jgi:hypothetical protein
MRHGLRPTGIRGARTGSGPRVTLLVCAARGSGDSHVVKWKWSHARGQCTPRFSWSVLHLGRDEHGMWLGARRGNPVLQPDGRVERQALMFANASRAASRLRLLRPGRKGPRRTRDLAFHLASGACLESARGSGYQSALTTVPLCSVATVARALP